MKAAVYHRYGPPDVVHIADVPRPTVKLNDVLVRVRAVTVSAGDSRMRSAKVPPGFGVPMRIVLGVTGPRQPILGGDLAGVVEAVGSAVTRFAVGDQVFASRLSTHAEYVAIAERFVAPMPANLTFAEAAALPFGGITSLIYLRDKARVQPGERVLIIGASGAVGSSAVQLAKHFGATVRGVTSRANVDLVRSLGADRVIDYTRHDVLQAGETYDVVLDAVGNCSFARCKHLLAPGGRLLLVVSSLWQLLGSLVRPRRADRRVLAGVVSVRTADLLLLRDLAERRALRPVIDSTYPFARIVDAHAHVDTGRKKGNVVVTLD